MPDPVQPNGALVEPKNEDLMKLETKIDKFINMFNNFLNRKPKDEQQPNPKNEDVIAAMQKKIAEQEVMIKNFKIEAEKQELAKKEVEKKEFADKVQSAIKVLIDKGVIPAADEQSINTWKGLFEANFDNAKLLADSQVKSVDDTQKNGDKSKPNLQKQVSEQLAKQQALDVVDNFLTTGKLTQTKETNN